MNLGPPSDEVVPEVLNGSECLELLDREPVETHRPPKVVEACLEPHERLLVERLLEPLGERLPDWP